MLICHNCGSPTDKRLKQCHHCHNFITAHAALSVDESVINHTLKVQLPSQPATLNSLMTKELIKANQWGQTEPGLAGNGHAGNGHSGNGYSGNGHSGNGVSEGGHSAPQNANEEFSQNSNPPLTPSQNIELKFQENIPKAHLAEQTDFLPNSDSYFLSLQNEASIGQKPEQESLKTEQMPFVENVNDKAADFFAELPQTTEDNSKQAKFSFSPENGQIYETSKNADSSLNPVFPLPENSSKIKDKAEESNILAWAPPSDSPGETKKSLDSPVEDTSVKAKTDSVQDSEGIHRRSFSGDFSSINTKKQEKSATSSTASQSIHKFLDRTKSFLNSNSERIIKNDKAKILGLKPWQLALAVVLVLFMLVKGFEAFCGIGGALTSNFVSSKPTSIAGRWQFVAKWNNGGCNGQMMLHQNGNLIYGQGIDQYGQYKFNGKSTANHIEFLKKYYVGNSFVGHTIEFQGDLDPNSNPLFLSGNFTKEYMEGGKWRGKPVTVVGAWEAEMLQPLIEDNSNNTFVPQIQKRDERPAAAYGGLVSNLGKHGTWLAVLVLGGGLLLYFLSRALIGPDGWLGIWDKQKYVPAQFMKEHRREKKALSKPIVKGSLPLGQRWEWKFWQEPFFWIPRYLAIPPDIRVNSPHVLILGGGEKGKSRLMADMITHDIESADRAIVLVDSDGDLADLLVRWMASHPNGDEYAKRTIIIDPTSNLPSPAFNPLELPDDLDLQNAASSIVHGFKAIYHEPPGSQNQWSPQTAHILRNCAMLLMANDKTLLDLPTLLQDNDFRDILLEKIEQRRKERVEYGTLLETWGQYKRLARTEQWINWYEPILNRVGPTLINQRLRPILTQPKGDINLKKIIAEKKILLVKIPKGQLHEDANLLGALIVTGMKQAAIALCTDGKLTDRTAVMYLDEFDHFIEKETLDALTTETKKFQLGFIGATKTLQHLPEDWRNQIEANIGTMCVFALTKKDGDMLGPRMFRVSGRKAKHRTLMNIFNPINTSPQFELISDEEKYNIDRVLAQSERQFYAYRVGAEAGIFRMTSLDFNDIPDDKVDLKLVEMMYKNR